jgi:hypothetical protein
MRPEGILTSDNLEAMAEAIQEFLSKERFTYVTVQEWAPSEPRIQTNQRLAPEAATNKKAVDPRRSVVWIFSL